MGWVIASTGRKDEAREIYRRAVSLLEQCVSEQPNVVSFRSNLAQALRALGEVLSGAEARASFAKARALGEAIVVEVPTVTRYRSDLAMTLMLAGNLARNLKDYAEAIGTSCRRPSSSARRWHIDHPDMVQYQVDLANSLSHLGLTFVDADRPADALPSTSVRQVCTRRSYARTRQTSRRHRCLPAHRTTRPWHWPSSAGTSRPSRCSAKRSRMSAPA